MSNLNLGELLQEFTQSKNINRPTMQRVLEDFVRSLIRKKYGSDENFDVIVNTTGDIEMFRVRKVVPDGEVTEESSQISMTEAREIDPDYGLDDECYQQLTLEEFGRRAIQAARQTLISRISELQKDEVIKRYTERVGDLVTCEVQQVIGKEFLLTDDATGFEMVMPKMETIRGDFFRKGDMVRGVIKKVEVKNNNPSIIVSRTESTFLERLLEQEVPEIEDGIITIRKIVRIPGERAKVAVESFDDRIDPVGACVGMKGSRIHGIVRELKNENIDIINFTNNTSLLIQRSLTPAKVSKVDVDNDKKRAFVYLDADQVSMAIGKGGSNINLATKLTGFNIDVFRNDTEYEIDDVDLDEFADEIEGWVIDQLKGIGCDTARSVLELSVEELARRTDLEEETIAEVQSILREEFEE
jgi:transcription termination/antitermination protein NusA